MQEIFVQKDMAYLQIEKWQRLNQNLKVGFTTRSLEPNRTFNLGLHVPDDPKNVIKNRERLAEKIGIPLTEWVFGEQIHDINIEIVDGEDRGKGSISLDTSIKGVDGMITKERGVVCAAFFADCVPLYFFDPHTEFIGIAHAGWRGSVNEMAAKMVDAFVSVGAQPEDILVTIGPCISRQQYEVDDVVINHIKEEYKEKAIKKRENNRYLLDLKQLNVEILLHSGIFRHNIDISSFCTYTDNHLFFSHRREGTKAGRMLGYIGYI